jgi:2-oxoglutarate ferredoxin oxidoreductase subunit delta
MSQNNAGDQQPEHQSQPEAARAEGRPADPAPEEKKHYDIDIFRAWCKACGICAEFCPRHCIRLDEEGAPQVDNPEQCTGCGWCELHCPDFAISVHERKSKNRPEEEE